MGRFDRIYSQEQVDAIIRAQCEDGISASKAVAKAATEGLYGLPPFEFKRSTASAYATEERRKAAGLKVQSRELLPPDKRLDAWAQQAITIAEHEAAKIGRKPKKTTEDLEKLRKLGQVMREIRSLVRGTAPTTGGRQSAKQQADAVQQDHPPTSTSTETDPASALVRGMTRDMSKAKHQNGHGDGDANVSAGATSDQAPGA